MTGQSRTDGRSRTDGAGGAPVGVLVMHHGTPPALSDVPAFYTEIRRGSPPPPELLDDLVRRYAAIGGTSPLGERTRAQVAGVAARLQELAPGRFEVRHGARFAEPRIEAAVADLAAAGARRVVGVVLAPHSSVVSVGEYRRRATEAAAAVGGLEVQVVDHWHDTPGFAEVLAGRVRAALAELPEELRAAATVLFSAHSVPQRVVDAGDTYPEQVRSSAAAVAATAGVTRWSVAWQSAGRTAEPWLGPDLLGVIATLPASGVAACVVCPIGFVSDHLEVLYDIDVEAAAAARAAGVVLVRTASLDDDPAFCDVLAQVVLRASAAAEAR